MLFIATTFLVGSLLPKEHEVRSTAIYGVPPDSVWAVITDFEKTPSWRPDVRSMKPGAAPNTWIEEGLTGELTYEIVSEEPPRKLVTRVTDPDLPFGGSWTYTVAAEGGGTRLTITETGEIRPAMFRFMARFVFGYHSTVDGYLSSLGKRFDEDVVPDHVEAGG